MKPIEIKESRLIVAEGQDAYWFCTWAYQAFRAEGIQVLDFGGINDLAAYLQLIVRDERFPQVETLVVVRDCETDVQAAIQSIGTALGKAELPVPTGPFQFADGTPRTAYMLFPGFLQEENGADKPTVGTLEDLCLKTVSDDPVLECVDAYLECVASKGQECKWPHKSRLHAFLAGKNTYVGMKIGEAAKAGAWDWDHDALLPLKQVIEQM